MRATHRGPHKSAFKFGTLRVHSRARRVEFTGTQVRGVGPMMGTALPNNELVHPFGTDTVTPSCTLQVLQERVYCLMFFFYFFNIYLRTKVKNKIKFLGKFVINDLGNFLLQKQYTSLCFCEAGPVIYCCSRLLVLKFCPF